jgi:hypothetical protein
VSPRPEDDAWLARPTTIRLLWRILWVVLALTVAAHFVIKVPGYFVIDAWYGFGAVFGFLACVLMVIVAKTLGVLLKRNQDYYKEGDDDV